MTGHVKARAFANIAIVKYWGKRAGSRNLPATPSISLALSALVTATDVVRVRGRHDKVTINGKPADKSTDRRIRAYIDLWRDRGLISGRFLVSSHNSFPTGAGLASSASGFAALATALSGFAENRITKLNLSRLARLGSGSAARSIPGGLAVLPTGTNPGARCLLTAQDVALGMVIAVTDSRKKQVGSREGMELSRTSSPYFRSWVSQSRTDYVRMLRAVARRDFRAVGEITEANALSMHACMIATRPSLLYWNSVTLDLITAAKQFRKDGLDTYFTIDAGPNVMFLSRVEDVDAVAQKVADVDGVREVIASGPAGGAEIIECT